MTQFYVDPTREHDKWSLPDAEVFYRTQSAIQADKLAGYDCWQDAGEPDGSFSEGWYYWYCFPGCLPESDPLGPFDTEADAIADARA